jgi:VanZ family protein
MPKVAASDKILHLLGYAGLTSLILIALSVRGNSLLRRTAIVAFVMPHYALLDEATQPLFNRHASLADWTFDVLGAGLALAAHALACLWLSARASQSE